MKDHKELDVWQKSMDFVQAVYELTGAFPKEEVYGLTSQLRRSAVSIPSNIAEGAARNTDKEFLYFLHIAQGSAAEAETQLFIARRLGYLGEIEAALQMLTSVKQMIGGLIRHYKNKNSVGRDSGTGTRKQQIPNH
jgi:four helix bundle protein